jgi:outer membrane biogenesis lipoprotein LolB
LALLLVLNACSWRPAPLGEAALSPDLPALWEKVSRTEKPVPVVKSRARMILEEEGKRYVQRATLLWQAPDRVRLEISPPIGLPNLFLTVSESGMVVFFPSRNQAYSGPATPGNISRFLLLDLPVAELTAALGGKTVPLASGEELRPGNHEDDQVRLDVYQGKEKKRSYWINPAAGRLAKSEFFTDSEVVLRLEFTDFRAWGDVFIPRAIEITQLRPEARKLTLQYLDLQREESGEEEYFRLNLPEGVKEYRLE